MILIYWRWNLNVPSRPKTNKKHNLVTTRKNCQRIWFYRSPFFLFSLGIIFYEGGECFMMQCKIARLNCLIRYILSQTFLRNTKKYFACLLSVCLHIFVAFLFFLFWPYTFSLSSSIISLLVRLNRDKNMINDFDLFSFLIRRILELAKFITKFH